MQRTAGDIHMDKRQQAQNIRAVHDAVHTTDPDVSILEVSSASVQPEGEAVSSLRLLLHLDSVAQDVPISTVFEATKVFEHGGPFADLLTCEPPKVHKDTRLRTSGELLRYSLEGNEYPTEPYMDSFFEWLYCRALKQFPEKAEPLSRYNAFSDIAAAADSKKVLWRFLTGGCDLCGTCSGRKTFVHRFL